MYTLYGSKRSGSAAAEVALERCGAKYRIVRASAWEPDSAIEELGRINPLRQIPTLVLSDGTVVSESAAILIHLGLAFPDAQLLSQDGSRRAAQIRGLIFIAANCYAALSVFDFPERWIADPDDASRARVQTAARAQLHRNWEIFADSFPASPYLSGERPGSLDYLTAVVSKWSGSRPHLQAARPAFYETLLAIETHPDVAPVFARHWDTPA